MRTITSPLNLLFFSQRTIIHHIFRLISHQLHHHYNHRQNPVIGPRRQCYRALLLFQATTCVVFGAISDSQLDRT